jgi:serine O-acetyltransferase
MKYCPNENIKVETDCEFLDGMVGKICATYEDSQGINHIEGFNLPNETEVTNILHELLEIIFPGYTGRKALTLKSVKYNIGEALSNIYPELYGQIMRALRYNCAMNKCDDCDVPTMAEKATVALIEALPEIRNIMKLDVVAAYDGDPAATSFDEIILSYPGIKAITIQRIAHVLYHQKVPLIPRMLSEYAHTMTGIDIHPGAHLGKSVFIDHGTGVVIGETAKIGDNVKIYQGVTLGALSFPKDACGKIIKGAKRHPTIEENVTIYAGATILGNILIGKGAIIGGNVWLTQNLEPGAKVTIPLPELTIRKGKTV